MKFYVSGKLGAEGGAQHAMEALCAAGHEITIDWTKLPHLRPYDAHPAECRQASVMEVEGVRQADCVVLVSARGGKGLFVELGIALACEIPVRVISREPEPTIYLLHPLVKRAGHIGQVIEEFASSATPGRPGL